MAREDVFPGEEIMEFNGFPTLIRFFPGDRSKPLVVFIPGAGHLGRIAYGTPNMPPQDFLAHWIQEHGHPFVAVSVPLEHPVFSDVYPEFTARDWGELVASAVRAVIDRAELPRRVVVVAWSAAGMTSLVLSKAASALEVEVALFVGLAATPPVPGLSPPYTETLLRSRAPSGMAEVSALLSYFHESLAVQNSLAGHVIISEFDYREQFLGNFPVNAMSTPVRYRTDDFVLDAAEAVEDMGTFEFWDFPPIAVITHDSSTDDQHSMKDVSQWSTYLVQVLYAEYHRTRGSAPIEPSTWARVRELVRHAPMRMSREVHGGHLCFLGRDGAQATAAAVVDLLRESDMQRAELVAALA